MYTNTRKKWKLTVLVMAVAVLVAGLTVSAWAKKPDKPPGGGGQEEPRYTIVDLGTFGARGSYAHSINELGQVAGLSYSLSPGGYHHAFLVTPEYDSDGNPVVWFRDDDSDGINDLMMDIGTLPGDIASSARGVNDSGQVVGYSYGETPEEARVHAFLWDSISGMVDLGTVGFDNSLAFDISNSRGYVVGWESRYADLFPTRAFIIAPEDTDGDGFPDTWFQDDGQGNNALMIDLGTLPGYSVSSARGVNDSGQVVGYSYEPFSDLGDRGFLITPEDTDFDGVPDTWFRDDGQGGNALMIELGPINSRAGSSASAINSSGQVVGTSGGHAVLWEVDAQGNVTVTDLGKAGAATSINDVGQVVGLGRRTAFLWENGTMTKLIDLIANSEGIDGLDAEGINEYGEIVGTIYGDGYGHAYIAVPIPAAP